MGIISPQYPWYFIFLLPLLTRAPYVPLMSAEREMSMRIARARARLLRSMQKPQRSGDGPGK
jgi:hypothetical protein